jgi:hypothetical protein
MTIGTTFGIALFALGTFISGLNFFLSFLRYPLHRYRGGTRENYHWISGFPAIGSLLLWISAYLLAGIPALMWIALAISLFDTGGLHWFAAAMLYAWIKHSDTS